MINWKLINKSILLLNLNNYLIWEIIMIWMSVNEDSKLLQLTSLIGNWYILFKKIVIFLYLKKIDQFL